MMESREQKAASQSKKWMRKETMGTQDGKRTKNIMTKESKESRQTTKVSFLNQVMRAEFCKQRREERVLWKYIIGV